MSAPTIPLDTRHYMTGHLVEVFQTMLSMTVTPAADDRRPVFAERVTGSVGLGGDTITGAVYLHLSSKLANEITAAMLGLAANEPIGETDVNDVIGECTNMLAGGLKSTFCDHGHECAVSTPAIIRGNSFGIESLPEVHQELLVFARDGEKFAVEIHVKFNETH